MHACLLSSVSPKYFMTRNFVVAMINVLGVQRRTELSMYRTTQWNTHQLQFHFPGPNARKGVSQISETKN